jgi:hypothetical protein
VPLALDFFKIAHDQKSYNLVHCWRDLKDYNNWKLTYAAYRRSFKNGGGNALVAVNPEEEVGNQGALPVGQGARMPPRAIYGSNSIHQNATRWDSKRRVMQHRQVFPTRAT